MKETIKQIRDFATATDNIYLLNKITLLEKQINNQLKDALQVVYIQLAEVNFQMYKVLELTKLIILYLTKKSF